MWRYICTVLLIATTAPAYAGHTYILDTTHSSPVFEFTHLGITTQSGRFDKAKGKIYLDRAARKGSVYYEIDASSLNMGFGTERPTSPGYRLFQVTKFPTITFKSDHLFFDDKGNVIAAEGNLTLLGVTKPVNVLINHFKCSISPLNGMHACAGEATATIWRSEFGMMQYIPAISDDIKVTVPIEAYRIN